jgi:hypothetical protein
MAGQLAAVKTRKIIERKMKHAARRTSNDVSISSEEKQKFGVLYMKQRRNLPYFYEAFTTRVVVVVLVVVLVVIVVVVVTTQLECIPPSYCFRCCMCHHATRAT